MTLPTCVHLGGKRKAGYRSRAAARRIAKRSHVRLWFYHCPRCGLWHVTKQPPRSTPQRERDDHG